ncbi:hypothetical protein ACEPAI_3032 [Sanghuangporus weigelae]
MSERPDWKKPFNVNRAAAQEWTLMWHTATPQDLGDLEKIADDKGIRTIENAVNKYFQDGFKSAKYKFWYFHSEGHTFTKVVVAENKPNYDMILIGEWPALGMVMFREEDENIADIWEDLANQIEEKGREESDNFSGVCTRASR